MLFTYIKNNDFYDTKYSLNDVILDDFLMWIKWRIQGRPIRPWPPIHFGYGLLQRRKKFGSVKFPNLCYNFAKKLVAEIRKCRQIQEDFVPLTLWPLYAGADMVKIGHTLEEVLISENYVITLLRN